MGEMISYPCPDGSTANGYLAKPAKDNAPGIVVIQEWWGLNDQMKKVADRFAEQGFQALVPDLYKGRVAQDPDEANHMMTGLDWGGAANNDIRGAVQYLKQGGAKAGVMGFCMGGALTIIAGVHVPETDACVCFYGIPPKAAADPTKISVPIQGHFASNDDWCNPEAVNALEADLKAGGVDHVLYRYEGTQHAFFNEARPEVYDQNAAITAWGRTVAFLETHLA